VRGTCRPASAVLAVAVALAGCGGASRRPPDAAAQARAAVQRYIDALGAKDAKAACAAMGRRGQACETDMAEAIAADQTSFKGAKATKVTLSRDHAVVDVDLASGGITRLAAVRVNGRWRYQATAL
jgi:hypothetical protein